MVCLLLQLGFISCESLLIYRPVNGSVTFSASNYVPSKEILWQKQKDKVVEWEENFACKEFPPFENKVRLDTKSGALTISNLTSEDEGDYEIKSPGIKDTAKFSLYVLEPPSSLTLNSTPTGENITVQCEIPGITSAIQNLQSTHGIALQSNVKITQQPTCILT
ncbi:Lymphocyte function-associated antigen 3 [Tupaia chinensis]|uniref:Lymphocyte function-associated antigen 3 n=1 Tax=Tupaia chinensis TaxID=246437 RepID=L9JQM4_TUPCH|nr:Lymphocyte function-associated antigen 3 [Tupaia chinensis]